MNGNLPLIAEISRSGSFIFPSSNKVDCKSPFSKALWFNELWSTPVERSCYRTKRIRAGKLRLSTSSQFQAEEAQESWSGSHPSPHTPLWPEKCPWGLSLAELHLDKAPVEPIRNTLSSQECLRSTCFLKDFKTYFSSTSKKSYRLELQPEWKIIMTKAHSLMSP